MDDSDECVSDPLNVLQPSQSIQWCLGTLEVVNPYSNIECQELVLLLPVLCHLHVSKLHTHVKCWCQRCLLRYTRRLTDKLAVGIPGWTDCENGCTEWNCLLSSVHCTIPDFQEQMALNVYEVRWVFLRPEERFHAVWSFLESLFSALTEPLISTISRRHLHYIRTSWRKFYR